MPLRRTTQRKYESSNGNIDQNGNATVCEKEKKRTVINNYITFTYKLIFTITAEILVLSLANFLNLGCFTQLSVTYQNVQNMHLRFTTNFYIFNLVKETKK